MKWYKTPEIQGFCSSKWQGRKQEEVKGLVRISDKYAARSQASRCSELNVHSSQLANFPGALALKFEFLMLIEKRRVQIPHETVSCAKALSSGIFRVRRCFLNKFPLEWDSIDLLQGPLGAPAIGYILLFPCFPPPHLSLIFATEASSLTWQFV